MITGLPLYNKILIILIDSIGFWLVVTVYRHIPKKKLNKIFLGSIISMFLWVNFAYLARLIGQQQTYLALICLKIAWFATPFLFVFLYFLVVYYLNKEKEYSVLNKIIFFGGIITALATGFTGLVIKEIEFVGTDLTIIYGKGMFPFLGIMLFFMCIPLYLLFKEYVKCLPKEKVKIEYLLVGVSIFYLANIIFNITFPVLFKIVYLYWVGDYSAIVLLGFIAYAVVKRELFGIRVVLTTALVSLITLLLVLDILVFTPQLLFKLFKSLILVIFVYFGYLLIRSVLREIELREKVRRAYEVEKRAHKGLKRLDEAKNQFIMATQHHLRTPLTSMIGYLDLIFGGTYGKVPAKLKETLLKFQISTRRLIKIVNEFLDITQFQLGKEVVSLKPNIDIRPILKEIMEELQFEAKARGIYLRLQKPGKIPRIKADPEKLKMALFNIVDNGIKYTPKGGVTIKFKIQKQPFGESASRPAKFKIIIEDTGMGIPKEELKTLFTRTFERSKEAKKVYGTGRGIGLFIAGHIIRAHNGKIWAESEGKGKGATFYIELPIG